MQRVGMILDVTHLSDQCFDEALDIYGGRCSPAITTTAR